MSEPAKPGVDLCNQTSGVTRHKDNHEHVKQQTTNRYKQPDTNNRNLTHNQTHTSNHKHKSKRSADTPTTVTLHSQKTKNVEVQFHDYTPGFIIHLFCTRNFIGSPIESITSNMYVIHKVEIVNESKCVPASSMASYYNDSIDIICRSELKCTPG